MVPGKQDRRIYSAAALSRQLAFRTLERNAAAARAESDRRATDPVERARSFLQRRGDTVYRASVIDGRADRWILNTPDRELDDEQLLAFALKKGFVGC